MTVRIMEHRRNGTSVVSIHGWIEGEDEARELLRVAREAEPPVILDLTELQTADVSGLAALHMLGREGMRLTHASDFIKLLLEPNGFSSPVPAGKSNGGAP